MASQSDQLEKSVTWNYKGERIGEIEDAYDWGWMVACV